MLWSYSPTIPAPIVSLERQCRITKYFAPQYLMRLICGIYMKLTIEIEKWSENEFDVTINSTRHFVLDNVDKVLERVSETLLEDEDTKITF